MTESDKMTKIVNNTSEDETFDWAILGGFDIHFLLGMNIIICDEKCFLVKMLKS